MREQFEIGDRVAKMNGYPFDSVVVSVFTKLDGQERLVCESTVIPGLVHIFSPSQMVLARPVPVPEHAGRRRKA